MLDIKEKQNQKSISKGSALSDAEMRFSLLPEALEQAALSGEKYGISYLQHDGSEYYQSYAELLHIARGIHTGLVTSGLKPQDKVIFQLKKNEDFIAALWGCFMSGVIPVPLATPPSYRDEHITLNKLRHTCELLDGAVILTDESDHSDVEIFIQGVGDKKTQVLSIESLMIETLLPGWHRSDPHDVALLLLTSGSTGKPKAVMQCHHSLLARTQAEIDVFGFSNKDISFNWMPLDHVGGIIMCHLRDVFAGITQIHAYTDYILQDPLKWIDTLDKYRVTATWAPNFAYGLINDFTEELKEKKWDLSCVRFALNGGEAIVSKTARDFLTSLAPFGFSQHAMFPAWGMSETCSGVTCNRNFNLTSSSDDDSFVSVGDPLPGVQIRIVNDNNEVLPEGESGYLQIQGAPVTSGYFNNADANKESFTADGWFITGDLGLIEDHSLTIIGRSKDVVIVNGINFYSHEVEAVAEQCAGVTKSFTAAFSVRKEGTDTDKVAVLFNPKPDEASKVKELINEIRTLILSKLGLNADYIIPVSKEQIPKTAIGKIQRTQLKNTFEAGTFDSLIAQWTTDNDTSRGPDWIFRKVWQPRKLLPIASAAQKKFLIFSPSEEIDDCLRKKLHPIQDVELLFIRPGSHFKDTKNGLVFIRPTVEDDFKKLVEILSQVFGNPDQILFLWSLQATEPPNISEFRSNIFPWEARTLLRIVQMLSPIFEEEEHEAGLYLATYRTQRVDSQDDVICYQNSVLLGLAHTLSKENPWFHCVCVDFDKIESASLIDLFFEEVSHNASEREISYRHDKRFIPRIEPVRHVEQDNIISLKEGGVYIVSGGLGGVGMSLTEELLSHYQANVLIIGRSDKKEKSCEIQTLENLPGNVAYEECDLGDSEKLNKIVYGFVGQHDNKLHGIFHLAGSYHEKSLLEETENSFENILYPKVVGALALEGIRSNFKDCVMVHFSSAISLSSGALTGAYTAANTFLNYFSNFQRYSLGAKSFSMAWSTWKNRGMSMGSESNELLKLKGFLDIQPDQGLNSLLAGLTSDEPEIYIGLDKANSNIRSMLTEEFLSDTKQDDTQTSPHSNHVPANSETEKKLVEIWQSLLKQPRIGITDNYFQLGGTSLIAARMFGQIQKTFNKNLPLSSLFKFATIEELAGLIDEGRDSPTEHEESFFQIIEIQKGGNKPPFFIIPGAGSDVVVFRSLAQLLGQAQPCYGLQAKGLDATDTGGKYFSVQDTAKEYVKLIKKTQSKGPFYVGGHCFGSLLAFEVAQQLGQQGDEVAVLALFDPLLGDEQSLEMFGTARLRYHFSRFFKASLAEKMGYIFTRIKNLSRTLIVKKRLNRSIEQVRTMYDNYEFCIYPSEITVFLAEDSFYKLFNDKDPRRIWSLHSRKPVVYIDTKGNHDSIINGQEVKYLAEKLALILEDKQHA